MCLNPALPPGLRTGLCPDGSESTGLEESDHDGGEGSDDASYGDDQVFSVHSCISLISIRSADVHVMGSRGYTCWPAPGGRPVDLIP